ncbi:hypothetical protein A9Q99_18600 [Gammaproteobacteria bacterium 45_16_T64]|nr:hypothetical protein A9Q99_18600 [Gammaproteobacteria bacterium 45_16_T64]
MNDTMMDAMELDMLCEAFNIGAHKSAKALSDLTSHSAELAIPQVKEVLASTLYSALTFSQTTDIVCIRLPMSDSIDGHAELVLTKKHADNLANLCLPRNIPEAMLPEVRQEMLAEIGNILLHACFGTVANMLNIDVDLSTPTIHHMKTNSLAVGVGASDDEKALAVDACLTLEGVDVEGFIVIYVGTESISKIKKYIQEFMVSAGIKVS